MRTGRPSILCSLSRRNWGAASEVMKRDEIAIRVDLGIGRGKARVFTCDLTKAYVEINGDYRS